MQGTLARHENKQIETCTPIVSCMWSWFIDRHTWSEVKEISLFVLELLMGQICSLARNFLPFVPGAFSLQCLLPAVLTGAIREINAGGGGAGGEGLGTRISMCA